MNFEAMQSRWNEYDRRLDTVLHASAAVLRQPALDKAKSSLQRLSRWIIVELLMNFIVVFFTGRFIAHHFREMKFLLPAIGVDVCAILLIVAGVHQLIGLKRSDLGAKIIDSQRQIETLRIQRIRMNKWVLMVGPLVWAPLLIVFFKGAFNLDVYVVFSTKWLIANVLFGAAFIPLMLWVSKRYGDRFHQSAFLKALMNDLAGRSLVSAATFLAELTRFEREPESH